MQFNIKNIEYKIAKNIKTKEVTGDVKVAIYNVKRKNEEANDEKYLEINIIGKIDDNEYPMHFIIAKPIEQYLEIEKYKSINIDEKDIMDCYLCIDGLADLNLVISNMKVTRFADSLFFAIFFKLGTEYYGNAEFEISIAD